jgi:enoyl-CoA hydratase/carnithine racemase
MSEVLIERPAPGVALLRLNRPERLNALSLALRAEAATQVRAAAADPDVRCLVLTGDDRAFAAGADLKELSARKVHDVAFQSSQVLWEALEACPIPVLAAVRGYALGGGCELMLHCDIVIAGAGAQFGQPEVKVGIMPGAGGTQRFVRLAGKVRSLRWLLTGDMIDAATALSMGLVSEVVPDEAVLEHALGIAGRIAVLPPLAVRAIKECVVLGEDAALPTALAFEKAAFRLLFASEDRAEGIAAFLERRPAVFKGV